MSGKRGGGRGKGVARSGPQLKSQPHPLTRPPAPNTPPRARAAAACLQVYNISPWVEHHPGGYLPLVNLAGRDATDNFLAYHPASVWTRRLPYFCVGQLPPQEVRDARAPGSTCCARTWWPVCCFPGPCTPGTPMRASPLSPAPPAATQRRHDAPAPAPAPATQTTPRAPARCVRVCTCGVAPRGARRRCRRSCRSFGSFVRAFCGKVRCPPHGFCIALV
jgi:hypothetical protein